MRCEEFEDRLNAVLDERRRPEWDAEVRRHSAECAECRKLAASYEVLLDGFYALATPEAPDDMALRVLADVQPRTAAKQRVAVAVALLATAAAVLIVVGPLLRTAPRQEPQVALHTTQPQMPAARAAAQASLDNFPLMRDFLMTAYEEDPYAGLAKETGQSLATMVLYVPGVGGGSGIIDVEKDSAAGEPAWAVQMSEGLKPLTETVTETVNLLLRSLPVSQFASRS